MNTLVLMVGLPRSGKSTAVKTELLSDGYDGHPCAVVCPDEIRRALGCYPFVAPMEPYVWAIARTMVQALFGAGHDRVILDATNITRRRRDEWRSPAWTREFIYIGTDIAVCKQRAIASGQDYLLPVIDRMNRDFQLPTVEEGPTMFA